MFLSGTPCKSLRPILFHIILKQPPPMTALTVGLRPILFHIILKQYREEMDTIGGLRPILFHIILKQNNFL